MAKMFIPPLVIARAFNKEITEKSYCYVQASYGSIKSLYNYEKINNEHAFLYNWGGAYPAVYDPAHNPFFQINHLVSGFFCDPALEEMAFYDAIQDRTSNNPNYILQILDILFSHTVILKTHTGKIISRYIFYLPNSLYFVPVPIIENPDIPEGKFFIKEIMGKPSVYFFNKYHCQ